MIPEISAGWEKKIKFTVNLEKGSNVTGRSVCYGNPCGEVLVKGNSPSQQ